MNDLTILFYTANVISQKIMDSVLEGLSKYDYPVISISHKPMNLGKNITVSLERSAKSIYKQILIGAKEATTEYVAMFEDDCFYTPEHFKYRPKHFGYNLNRWSLHLREGVYSFRERPVMSQCIANRVSLIDTLEERFALPNLPESLCAEPGRLDHTLGIKEYGLETFKTDIPNLVICHNKGTFGIKRLSNKVSSNVEGLGESKIWVEKLT